jgi:Peptidase S46
MKKFIVFLVFLPFLSSAQGGMWLPMYLEKLNEKDMKSMGCKLDADDIYSINENSLKDAICMFDGGCTGELISNEGLLLTNHHCGFDAIQTLSTLEKNYVEDGFWSKNKAEELPAAGVTAMFVSRMEDVTAVAMMNVNDLMPEKDRQAQIDKNLAQVKANTKKEAWEEILIRPFYAGNQYFMFITVTFKDVRLVGTPPSSIGKFGADTDNWVWPRHTGDFSLFRVYANKDNKPADFAADNVPYKPKQFLSISLDGVEEGDFTMVYGFPGRTDEYLPAAAVKQTGEVLDPAKVAIRDRALKIMDGYMRKDPAVKIAYISKYAGIANAWKKWLGEMQGLKTYKALDNKKAYETEFVRRIQANPSFNTQYMNILPRLNQAHQNMEPYAFGRDYYFETMVRNNEIMGTASALNGYMKQFDENGEVFFQGKIKDLEAGMEGFYKDYKPEVDQSVFAGLTEMFAQNSKKEWGAGFVQEEADKKGGFAGLADFMFKNSILPNKDKMMALLKEKPSIIAQTIKADPAFVFWKKVNESYVSMIQPKLQEYQPQITALQRQYMAAQMVVFKDKKFFPDANSTLRVTYGKVKSYHPKDGITYDATTYLDGVMEKYIPGDYEFDVPKKLISLYQSKDYGQYATADGRMPVAFIGSNHTTGGNSGSPALDAKGNLIGLNFDRVWEGTMSDLNYDPAICRNIMVDVRYVLFIVDKYAGATNLISEMKLVKGQIKRKKKCK